MKIGFEMESKNSGSIQTNSIQMIESISVSNQIRIEHWINIMRESRESTLQPKRVK